MAFEDLLLPDAQIWGFDYFPYVVGDSLLIPVVILDTDNSTMNLSSGYTAELTLNRADGGNVVTFTNTLTSGRVLDLSRPTDASTSIVIRSTPTGMAPVATFVGRNLRFNLQVKRTSDGLTVTVMRSCFLDVRPELD